MRSVLSSCALGAALTGGAQALTPLPAPLCENPDGSVMREIFFRGPQEAYVQYQVLHEDESKSYDATLHCASGRQLVVTGELNDAGYDFVIEAWNSDEKYTFNRVARKLRGLGNKAKVERLKTPVCACDSSTFRY
ncbi:hypothetical protein IV417_02880 [Alphaproteobacteria bacterium KMM 3653]|uniref:Uncharacterized protein n=1 Tax=Harenicola maris TaxID=2841044 RepID=A0AAP2G2S6_9RHOB|nr:hypothetical protein [Harenicola maris]